MSEILLRITAHDLHLFLQSPLGILLKVLYSSNEVLELLSVQEWTHCSTSRIKWFRLYVPHDNNIASCDVFARKTQKKFNNFYSTNLKKIQHKFHFSFISLPTYLMYYKHTVLQCTPSVFKFPKWTILYFLYSLVHFTYTLRNSRNKSLHGKFILYV